MSSCRRLKVDAVCVCVHVLCDTTQIGTGCQRLSVGGHCWKDLSLEGGGGGENLQVFATILAVTVGFLIGAQLNLFCSVCVLLNIKNSSF